MKRTSEAGRNFRPVGIGNLRPEATKVDGVNQYRPVLAAPRGALILRDEASARDYCGSLANIVTAYAFLAGIVAGRHKEIIVTAGNSATGIVMPSLARIWETPTIFLVRTNARRDELTERRVQYFLSTQDE